MYILQKSTVKGMTLVFKIFSQHEENIYMYLEEFHEVDENDI